MAEKRMINKSISVSEKVNVDLPDIFHMLLFTWIIPHTDDFGRLTGSPAKIKALIIPMLDKSIKDVEKAIYHMHKARLIQWYEVDEEKYIEVLNFDDHQTGLHKRTTSKYPDPPSNHDEVPGNSGKFQEVPSELNRTEQNRTEQEEKGTNESDDSFLPDSPEYILTHYLFDKIKENNPKAKEPNFKQWIVHTDKILRLDNYAPQQVKNVIEWCQQDDFWKPNILSTKKLREKMPTLILQMQRKKPNSTNKIQQLYQKAIEEEERSEAVGSR